MCKTMKRTELEKLLNDNKQYKEIWLKGSDNQSLCALINGILVG